MKDMSKGAKVLLGVLAFAPILYVFAFTGIIMTTFGNPGGGLLADPKAFAVLFAVHGSVMLLIMGQLVFYVVHALTKNPSFTDGTQKAVWALILFMGNMLAIPIYFMIHIWPDREMTFDDDLDAFS